MRSFPAKAGNLQGRCHIYIYCTDTDEMFRYEEVSILEGSVLGPGPHYWGLGAQQTKARPAKRYRKCILSVLQ